MQYFCFTLKLNLYISYIFLFSLGLVFFCFFFFFNYPTPKIHWFFNSMKLTPSMDCKLVFAGNDHSLILPYVGMQDEGEYTCVASNVHGETTCNAHLHVRQRIPGVPCFAREPDSVRCAPGFTAVFEYTVAGEPCPSVQWFKGSEQLFSDAHRSVAHHPDGSGSLTVRECMEEDTGLYTCRAVNTVGEATCSAELLVVPEEHAVCRQSPALQHSAVAEDQSPVSYEEAGELPAMEGVITRYMLVSHCYCALLLHIVFPVSPLCFRMSLCTIPLPVC
uniref:Ig-like domain-containing protein n=1 Tax=Calidris pygmaea TaxID=425635 RepID=A0A8C3KHR4_9CHAR